MTSTIETPTTITPCPVDWCPDAGHHRFDDEILRDLAISQGTDPEDSTRYNYHTRTCRYETGWREDVQIGAETYYTDEGVQLPVVVELDIHNLELTGPAEVTRLVEAVQRAAAIAFPGMSSGVVNSEDVPNSHTPDGVGSTDPIATAERAVLKAVSDWCNGYGPQSAIGDAHDALAMALTEPR